MAPRVARPPASVSPSEWTAYMARGRVSSALLLFGLVAVVQWLKHDRQLPDRRTTAGLLVGAFVVTATASVAPDFVTMLMVAMLVVVALDNQDVVVRAIGSLQDSLAPRSTPDTATGAGGRRAAVVAK